MTMKKESVTIKLIVVEGVADNKMMVVRYIYDAFSLALVFVHAHFTLIKSISIVIGLYFGGVIFVLLLFGQFVRSNHCP